MRKLAPMFVATSILALAGTAFANTSAVNSTDKNGQPTVSDNTNKQPLSYSDKSSTAKGTNAKMGDDQKRAAAGSTSTSADTTLNSDTKAYVAGEDKKEMRDESKEATGAKKTKHAKKHVLKHKEAKATTAARDDTMPSSMPTAKPSPSSDNPPASATKGEVANSTTGKSAGQ